jgi:hypothetical protein
MSLTERTVTDKIEVLESGRIQIREANVIERDGVEISRVFHRYVLRPGDDVSGRSQRIQDVAAAVWTQEVIDAFQANLLSAQGLSPSEEL